MSARKRLSCKLTLLTILTNALSPCDVSSDTRKQVIDCTYNILNVGYLGGLFSTNKYEGWNFNSGNYLFTTDTK